MNKTGFLNNIAQQLFLGLYKANVLLTYLDKIMVDVVNQ